MPFRRSISCLLPSLQPLVTRRRGPIPLYCGNQLLSLIRGGKLCTKCCSSIRLKSIVEGGSNADTVNTVVGSGFHWYNGWIMTNTHVLWGMDSEDQNVAMSQVIIEVLDDQQQIVRTFEPRDRL
jgi:S1-C subfamily serine protease